MSVLSMTGFGAATMRVEGRTYRLEVRAVNHRGTNLRMNLPQELARAEPAAKSAVRARLMRGAIDVQVRPESAGADDVQVHIDRDGVKAMLSALQEVAYESGAPGPTLDLVLRMGDFVEVRRREISDEALDAALHQALDEALGALEGMRRDEGEALARDLGARVEAIEAMVGRVEGGAAAAVEAAEARLRARLDQLREKLGVEVDEQRVAAELVMYADKMDVTEEIVRARAHLERVRGVIASDEAEGQGKTLDFLCQELLRELNTMGSKCRDAGVGSEIVDAKVELEKMREQVQNIV